MKSLKLIGSILGAVALVFPGVTRGQTAGSAFTYQGQLKEAGRPANGIYDFQFSLYDDVGGVVAGPITLEDQPVTQGLFSVTIDFGANPFAGDARFLEVGVRPGASLDPFTTLWPRQELTPTPYASMALATLGVDGHSLDAADSSPTDAIYVADDGEVRLEEGGLLVFDTKNQGVTLTSDTFHFSEGTSEDPVYDYRSSTDTHQFWTNGTSRMVIDASGHVGIGLQSPNYELHVGGDTGFEKNAWFNSGAPFEIAHQSNTGLAIDPGIPAVSLEADGQQILTAVGGRVGIGVASPSAELDINGGIKTRGFQMGSSATAGYVLTTDTDGIGSWQPPGAGGSLWTIAAGGIYYDAGYVGIGMSTPNYPLHVADWTSTPVVVGDNRNEMTVGQLGANDAGVYGTDDTTYGKGVYGLATKTTGTNYGVYGETASSGGYGVYGNAANGTATGVRGQAYNGCGLMAEADGPFGCGVEANNLSDSSATIHGHNESQAVDSKAIWGESPNGFGGFFDGKGYFSERVGIGTDAPDYPLHVTIPGSTPLTNPVWSAAVYGENPYESAFGLLGSELGGVYGEAYIGVFGQATLGGYGGYFWGRGFFSEDVGIGTTTPTEKLDVVGTVKMTGLQLGDATSTGYVLTANANGVGTWQPPPDPPTPSPWSESAPDIYFDGGKVGIGTSTPQYDLHLVGTNGGSHVLVAENIPENTYGVLGGEYHGVYGESRFGVFGVTTHETGTAVSGVSTSSTGINYGVYGQVNSPNGYAGYFDGRGYFSGGVGIGVTDPSYPLHVTASGGTVIRAVNDQTLGDAFGIWAETASTTGRAVKGVAIATTGNNYGVQGESSSPTGVGVFGRNVAGGYGIMGEGSGSGWAGYFYGRGYFSGNVGIGRSDPQAKLDVNGTVKMNSLQIGTTATAGYVLTTDGSGVGTWQELPPDTSFNLPYSGAVSDTGPAFEITNNGTGQGAHGIYTSIPNGSSSDAVAGFFTAEGGTGKALKALADTNNALFAQNNSNAATIFAQNDGAGDVLQARVGNDLVFKVAGTGTTHVDVLAIEGGADLAERFDVGSEAKPGMVVEIDPGHAGKLRVARSPYSRLVAGVLSGANGVEAGMILADLPGDADSKPVALTGRVWVYGDATSKPIAPGDLLTTAERPGHAMAVADHERAQGAVLGKAMTGLEQDTGLVLVLVTLQ